MALSEADSDENPEFVVNLQEHGWPLELTGMNDQRYVIGDWDELLAFIESRPKADSELDRVVSFQVAGTGKRIALSSLVAPEVQPYFAAYGLVTARFNHGPLFPGSLAEQPNILVEAFQVIESEINAYERRQMQQMKREAAAKAAQHGQR